VARSRKPVRCPECGLVSTPVSGFCRNCLGRLPLRMGPLAYFPLAAALALALVAGGAALAVGAARAGPGGALPVGVERTSAPPKAAATTLATASPTVSASSSATPGVTATAVVTATARPTAPATPVPTAVLGATSGPAVRSMPDTATSAEDAESR